MPQEIGSQVPFIPLNRFAALHDGRDSGIVNQDIDRSLGNALSEISDRLEIRSIESFEAYFSRWRPITATWDGTSMATPHVSGAAALYLSQHPQASWREIKEALIRSAKPITALTGKSVSNGKLDVDALMNF